jgi:hypothetical protein
MKNILIPILCGFILYGASAYQGGTTAAVLLAGGVIKAQGSTIVKKYNRRDCPVCKGKGYYISGDGIAKIECNYCEAPRQEASTTVEKQPNCNGVICKPQQVIRVK